MSIGSVLLIGLVLWLVLWFPEVVGKLVAGTIAIVVFCVGFVAFMFLLAFVAGAA